MPKRSFATENCSLARTMELVGDSWSLLIVREALLGASRFDQFQACLGIARNVLTVRLRKLADNGIFESIPLADGGKRLQYRLTDRGFELVTLIGAAMQWGDRNLFKPGRHPVRIVDQATGHEIPTLELRSSTGQALDVDRLDFLPGPGATAMTRRRLAARTPPVR
jgi:DNA-binding HxlR family transcriptional regulator